MRKIYNIKYSYMNMSMSLSIVSVSFFFFLKNFQMASQTDNYHNLWSVAHDSYVERTCCHKTQYFQLVSVMHFKHTLDKHAHK